MLAENRMVFPNAMGGAHEVQGFCADLRGLESDVWSKASRMSSLLIGHESSVIISEVGRSSDLPVLACLGFSEVFSRRVMMGHQ